MRTIKTLLTAIIFIAFLWYYPQPAFAASNLYVSPQGSDSNPGTESQPLRSLEGAQQKVRALISAGLKESVIVNIKGGTYALASPLTFDTHDSGTDAFSITYQAYNNESVKISGAQEIKNWVKVEGNIWSSPVIAEIKSGSWQPLGLFKNNTRLQPARFPDGENYLSVQEVSTDRLTTTFTTPIPGPNFNLKEKAKIVILHHWTTSILPLSSKHGQQITTVIPIDEGGVPPETPEWGTPYTVVPGRNAFLFNSRYFLSQPGEWYLDSNAGKILYYAANNENPNTANFFAPKLDQLLVVQGKNSQKIKNLIFRGLTFEFANWGDFPVKGYKGMQAGGYESDIRYARFNIPTAIFFQNTENSLFTNNTVRFLETSGVGIGMGTNNVQVFYNSFFNIGGTCIDIGWAARKQDRTAETVPSNNKVSNNTVDRCGEVYYGTVGIGNVLTKNTLISHNLVKNLPYTGISILGNFGGGLSLLEKTAITYNKVHNVMQRLADGAGIYTHGQNQGGIVQNNVVHDVKRHPLVRNFGGNRGLYFDTYGNGYSVSNNLTYNIEPGRNDEANNGYTDYFLHDLTEADFTVWGPNYWGLKPGDGVGNITQTIFNQAGPVPQPSSSPSPSPSPSPKPGDLTDEGDTLGDEVNIHDYNLLKTNFISHPYTIFDYNILVANYGK